MQNISVENDMVFILDKNKRPLGFCSNKRAQEFLDKSRAVIHCFNPFVIRLKDKDARNCEKHLFKIKIDPGSKETGIAITDREGNVYYKAILVHRGQLVVKNLQTRSGARKGRRARNTPYRRCKYKRHGLYFKSKHPDGWLPPSIMSIEQNIINIVRKFMKYCNIVECTVETVSFDIQKMDNPNIENWEYQHDTKEGKTIRAYLFDKYGGTCQYCGGKTNDHRIEVEHIVAKTNGGTGKVSNLTIACHTCNQDKGNYNLDKWLEMLKKSNKNIDKDRVSRVSDFLEGNTMKPKNYAVWVNSYKNRLVEDLCSIFCSEHIETSDGVTTKMNRERLDLAKEHYNDAICIGNTPDSIKDYTTVVHKIIARGRGTRLKGQTNCCGILSKVNKKGESNIHKEKTFKGFQTGDLCKIKIPKGKYKGEYVSRIAIRHNGQFDFNNKGNRISTNWTHCNILQHNDGYEYHHCRAN